MLSAKLSNLIKIFFKHEDANFQRAENFPDSMDTLAGSYIWRNIYSPQI